MPPPSPHSFGQIALSLACVGFFATLGVLVGGIGEGLVFTTLTLAAEPFLWFVGLSLALNFAVNARGLAALTTSFALQRRADLRGQLRRPRGRGDRRHLERRRE